MTRNQTILFYAGACMTLVVAFVLIQEWQMAGARHSTGGSNTLTAEQTAELFRPVKSANSSKPTDAEINEIRKPVKGGVTLTAEDEADLFKSVPAGN